MISMPKLADSLSESVTLASELYLEGIETPYTFSFPIASTATAATRAESMPPLSPIATFLNPFLLT